MRGTVYRRALPSGRVVWQVQIDAGRDESGKRIRITKTFERKRLADDELTRMLRERQNGPLVKESTDTLGSFIKEWLTNHAERKCARKTAERYHQLAGYAVDALGHVPLNELSTLMLERFYGRLQDGNGKAGRPLSIRTIRHIHETVRSALKKAVTWKYLIVNPAVACELPHVERKEARVLEDAELRFLLDAALGHPWMYALLLLDSATGLRRGELLALRWSDADLVTNYLMVSKSLEQTKNGGVQIKTTKNRKGRRLTLPQVAADVLREHRRAQQQFRDAYGADYRTDLDLIFATPSGDYLKPNTVSPAVCDLAARCGLKGIGLHTLRHTHGSQLLAAGIPITTVSERLGHSNVQVTSEIYAHSFQADEVAAAKAWDIKIGSILREPAAMRH